MNLDSNRNIIGLIGILLGILIIIYPSLVGYLVGIFLIIYGALKIFE